jgi:hypothetical protein
MKKYKIRDGFTFIDENNAVRGGGSEIDLPDDIAQLHLHKLELAAPVQTSAPRKAAGPKAAAATPAPTPAADPGAAADPAPVADSAPQGEDEQPAPADATP